MKAEAHLVGQVSDLPVKGVSDSSNPSPITPNSGTGLQRRPQPTGHTVGQDSDLPVKGVSDSSNPSSITANSGTGLQRRPEPAGQRPAPQYQSQLPSKLVAGIHSRGALPHLKREGTSYFVTFRLDGTIPQEILLKFKRERESIIHRAEAGNRPLTWQEQKELFNWYSERVDGWLNAGHGDCWLRQPEIASLVAGAIRHFEGQRYTLSDWVVMPNHVHVVIHAEPPHTLSTILKSWKGFTAVHANRLLNRAGTAFWQSEAYDHCCRDDEDLALCCAYTRTNPVAAGLCSRPEDWPWSSARPDVGQVSDLPVKGVSDSSNPSPTTPNSGTGLQRRPQPAGQRPAPQSFTQ